MSTPAELASFESAVRDGIEAGWGDSNDAEISCLQTAVQIACDLLGVDYTAIENEAEKEHT